MSNGKKFGVHFNEIDNLNSEEYEYCEKFLDNLFKDYLDVKVPKNQDDYSLKKSIKILKHDLDDVDIIDFCKGNDVSPTVLFMAATLLTLDKFTYSPNSLLINIFNGKNNSIEVLNDLPIVVDRNNRSQSIKSLLANVDDCWKDILKYCLIPIEKILSQKNITATIAYGYFENFSPESMKKTVFEELGGDNRDLEICFIRNDNDFAVYLIYNSQLYTSDYMDAFLNSVKTIICKIINVDIEKSSIKDISLTDELFEGDSSFEIPTLVELFEKQVNLNPSKTALIVNDEEISYEQLNQNANRIANSLLEKIDSKSNVVILLPRSKEFMYSIWGVLKAGCSFVPLDGSYPKDRIEFIIGDSNSSAIITDGDMDNSLNPQELLANDNIDNPDVCIDVDDLAYMLYTSGTTGVPKGVFVSHKNIANIVMPSKDNILNNAFTEDIDKLLTLTAVNYTPSVRDVTLSLTSGLTLVYANNDEIDNINSLIALIEKHKPQMIGSITPSRLTEFLDIPKFVKAFGHIKKIVLLGEKFPPSLYTKIKSKNPSVRVYNDYGSTETVFIALKEVVSEENITIGFPGHNVERYIMDMDENVLPAGIQGQLYISGPSITQGYSDKELNGSYVNINGKRLFKTGDLAYSLGNGEIVLLGRVDKQIKLRGQRLEPDEITALINRFENISNSAITLKEINGLQHLIAYYVCDAEINEDELIVYLESKLPMYMIPSQFIQIPEIPTNLNGKLDVSQLPEPSFDDVKYEAPTNEKEELVVNAFEDLFNKKIGINDDFISLGGTSLSSMHILSHLSGYNITTAEILQLRTPKKIAAHLKEINIDLDKYGFDDVVPLSASQLNVYLDELVNDMGTGYNNSFKVEFENNYSAEDIKNALIKLFEVYPILKTRIITKEKSTFSIFDAEIEIEEGTLSDVESFVRPFELNKCLSRFLIVEDGQSTSLCFDIHHLIFDGTSLNILLDTLFSILNNENVDFRDNGILRQISFEENINTQDMDEVREFYDVMMADIDEVYGLLPSVENDDEFEYIDTFDMDDEYLSSFLKDNEITHNQLFTSVFAYNLSRFTGSSKVLFSLIVDGRGHIDLSESVGMFVKTLPILVDCKNQNVSSFFRYSSNLINSVMKYDLYPLNALTNKYDFNTDVYFQYSHNIFKNEVYELKHDIQRDLTFFVYIADEDKLGIKILYSEKFSKEFIKHFADSYISILNEIMDVKELSDINYTSQSDLTLLDFHNERERSLKYGDILDAFNDNLAKFPNNNLVSMGNNSYTYSQGAFIADKIAKKLVDLGVDSQDRVAFLVERSELYMFSILGILSIGAVYVPLDDTHPDARLKYILEDVDVDVVIVSDKTVERAKTLSERSILLNISGIVNGNVGGLTELPAVCGDLACILYTSGTTGNPKGVKITSKSILNVSQYYEETYALGRDDVYGLYASIGFDVATFGIFATLYVGACLSVVPGDIKLDMSELNRYYISQKIKHTVMTTPVAKLFVSRVDETSLEVLLTGGEKLGEIAGPDNFTLVDVYGPTESFMFTNTVLVNEKIDYSSVGFFNYNVKAYILDEEGRRVPFGAVGELYLSGYQIADGYFNRKKETDYAFIENPFDDSEEFHTLYRTGDIVRFLPDYSLGIVGRKDSQVKIRGNRVELSEVEAVIREMDYIEDVTVKTIKNGDKCLLVAYVVSDELEGDALRDAIQNNIGDSKPNYMIPSYVVELDEIPLNVNGKVDKRKLPEITTESNDYETPEGYFEIVIANVFSEVLNIDQISRNDEFSSLGGDSIDVISLISKLREMNIHVTVKDVMDNQTVKRIAKKAEYKISTSKISQESFEGFVDSTPTTRYFRDLKLKNPSFFHVPCLLETSKRIDKDILAESMRDVVNYHDMLRAIVKDGKLFVRPQNDEEIFTIEYGNPSNFTEETERINKEIDIFNGPLIKLAIFEQEKGDYLYICFHHLLVDPNSLRIIINDLNLAYTQRSLNMETELYSKTSSYQDYALAAEKYKTRSDVLQQKEYWENTLSSLKKLKHTEINSDVVKRDSFPLRLSYHISSILFTNAPRYYGCSINCLFLSMLVKSWKEVMGENEVSVRLTQNDRMNFDRDILIERTVGWLNSVYPIILKCEGQQNKEIIANVEKMLSDVPNNGFDYSMLMGIETSEIPLIAFNYINEFNIVGGGKMFNSKHSRDLAKFTAPENNFMCDITIYGYTIDNETFFKVDYNSERFTREIMEKFGRSFLNNINSIVSFTAEDYSEDAYIFSNHPDKKKLFFIHSANFGSEYFYYMAQMLKDEYSFIVIEPYNRNHRENQLSSIEEFAEKYIGIIKSIQPEGPYYIGGYCFGGIIAHEMAIQLKKQNEDVDKLILFESYYIDDDELKELALEEQILYAGDFLKDGILNPKHETIEAMINYALSSVNIMYSYKPGHYDGDVIYFRATVRNDGETEISAKLNQFYESKMAGGYEDCYDDGKLQIKSVPVGHDYLLSVEALKIIIPELIKFIER